MDELTDVVFNRYLMDLGANVLVVVILIVAVYLSYRTARPAMTERTEMNHHNAPRGERAWACPRESDGQLIGFKKEYA